MTGRIVSDDLILRTAALWAIDPVRVHRDLEISGSPERSELRFVVEGGDRQFYVIESIQPNDIGRKKEIVDLLDALNAQHLSGINPYVLTKKETAIEPFMGRYWKLSPFVKGVDLKRPEYVFDKWRGNRLAGFLLDLRRAAADSGVLQKGPAFSLKDYVVKLIGEIKKFNPERVSDLEPVFVYLENGFMTTHDRLPLAFCHGDYHPVNVIWGASDVRAVIDWEFSGVKPEIYDAANLLGCLGIEQPEALAGPFASAFIEKLKREGFCSGLSWQTLIPFTIALRFAWLAEWLRRKDTEMIDLEIVYMNLLVNNEDKLSAIWGVG